MPKPSIRFTLCQHIKTNGELCRAPALRGKRLCHFHQRARRDARRGKPQRQDFPLLEDANSVQRALQQIAHAILDDAIDSKRAGLMLYCLQTAALNLKETRFQPWRHYLPIELYVEEEEEQEERTPEQETQKISA